MAISARSGVREGWLDDIDWSVCSASYRVPRAPTRLESPVLIISTGYYKVVQAFWYLCGACARPPLWCHNPRLNSCLGKGRGIFQNIRKNPAKFPIQFFFLTCSRKALVTDHARRESSAPVRRRGGNEVVRASEPVHAWQETAPCTFPLARAVLSRDTHIIIYPLHLFPLHNPHSLR